MNKEKIFYDFTKAMDLKFEDSVEAIHDLCKFCITTENYGIWSDIYDFVRAKAQEIIDLDNPHDKQDCIQEFENDTWVTDYIKEVNNSEDLDMSLNSIINIVKKIEEDVTFDVEAPTHWYAITYKNNKLKLSEIDEYHFNGDEWGEMEIKTNISTIKEFECTAEEYINFIIKFFNAKMLYQRHQYPLENYVIEKIDVVIE